MRGFLRTRRPAAGIALGLIAILLWLSVSFAVAYKLTRRPFAPFAEPTPEVAWGRLEPLRLKTSDGLGIGGWFAEGQGGRPSVVLLHGNRGNRLHLLRMAQIYAEHGCAVLLISLRAHGDSDGDHNDIGWSARKDVVAAVEFLERRRPGEPVIVHGISLGSAAASFASGELGRRVSGYVLECPYRDLKTAVYNRTAEVLPIGLDWLAYLGLRIVAPVVVPELDRVAPVEAVGGIPAGTPVLILAGALDRKARPEEAREIAGRLGDRASVVVFPNGRHENLIKASSLRYREALLAFLERVRPRS